ncbi:hypothetical protein [Actinophytocola sediminis]
MNPLSLLTGPAPALLLLASPESSSDPEVSSLGPILGVVGVLLGVVLLVIAVAAGLSRLAEHRRMERARLADDATAPAPASRALYQNPAAAEETPELVGSSGPHPSTPLCKERRLWPG